MKDKKPKEMNDMVMKKFGDVVANHPRRTVTVLIVISLIAAGLIGVLGIDQEFSESSFMPDEEAVLAQEEMGELFSTTDEHRVSLLVRGKNGDVLTSHAMVEMLTVSRDFVNDGVVSTTLMYPQQPTANVYSVATILGQTVLSQYGNMDPTFEEMIGVLGSMSDLEIKQTLSGILASEHTPPHVRGIFFMLLTKDFDPATNSMNAKGTMMMVSLDGTLRPDTSDGMTTEKSPLSISEERMDRIVKESDLESIQVSVLGSSLIMDEIMEASNRNMNILLPVAFILVIVILGIVFRSAIEVLICLTALVMGILWMYGFGTALGFSFNPMTIVVPILMVGLGIDYGIHLTMRHREETRKGKDLKSAAGNTVKFVGTALLLVTITTVAAFMSNLASPMGPLREFGFIATIGIISCFFTMVAFVPACLHIKDQRKARKLKEKLENGMVVKEKRESKLKKKGAAGLYKGISLGASTSPRASLVIILIVCIITIGAVVGAMNLETTFDFEDFLPQDLQITKDINFMMNEFAVAGGEAEQIQVLVKGNIADPALFTAMSETVDNTGAEEFIIQQVDGPDVLWIGSIMRDWATEPHQGFQDGNYNATFAQMYHGVFHEDGSLRSDVTGEDLTSLYTWLYMNPGSYMETVSVLHMDETSGNFDATALRIHITLIGTESEEMNSLIDNMKGYMKPLETTSESAVLTGSSVVGTIILDVLNESAMNSLILTLIICTVIMVIVFYIKDRSIMLGLLTMVPVIFCVLWILGTMYVMGISLNIMTLMVTSLTIGIGVDYGIHISNRFMEDIKKFERIPDALYSTVSNTGLPLFGGAASTIAGFGLLSFATMPPIAQFGLITALTILYSSIAAVYLLPTLLGVWSKWKKDRR